MARDTLTLSRALAVASLLRLLLRLARLAEALCLLLACFSVVFCAAWAGNVKAAAKTARPNILIQLRISCLPALIPGNLVYQLLLILSNDSKNVMFNQ
ncbi:hypothetical protein [Chitiniphilus shinanonensis]|uniref:hypothetical protein n=1 Tax=Chitiniphilus shinanonensis TaxID=553088 RepID=UPI003340B3D7